MAETTVARYFQASRAAHRAWCASQPQYVIPGLLDALDAVPPSPFLGVHTPRASSGAGDSIERVVGGTGPQAGDRRPSCRTTPQPRAASLALNPGGEPRHDIIPPEVTPHSSGAEPRHSSCPAPASVSTAGSVAASINATRTAPSSAQGLRGRPQKGA